MQVSRHYNVILEKRRTRVKTTALAHENALIFDTSDRVPEAIYFRFFDAEFLETVCRLLSLLHLRRLRLLLQKATLLATFLYRE